MHRNGSLVQNFDELHQELSVTGYLVDGVQEFGRRARDADNVVAVPGEFGTAPLLQLDDYVVGIAGSDGHQRG
jgi:hypothetical protein